MTRFTGIHLSYETLRLATLETSATGTRLCTLFETQISLPFDSSTLRDDDDRRQLGREIKNHTDSLEVDFGRMAISLGGGIFQIQKVPLEVASQEDRQDQITWEASQALISSPREYEIDFHPAGRVAFWVAVRKEVINLCRDLYATAGFSPEGFYVEPLALYRTCEFANLWTPGSNAAVFLGHPWISFIAAEDTNLVTAETVQLNDGLASQNRTDDEPDQEICDHVRHWIFGDASPRRSVYQNVLLCGSTDRINYLVRRLSNVRSSRLLPVETFSNINTNDVNEAQKPYLEHPGGFGIAVGLASQLSIEDSMP